MDIELTRLRNKDRNQGYQRLESAPDEEPVSASTSTPTPARTGMSSNSRSARTYGAASNSKGKGKGKATYSDRPEDEVGLLGGDDSDEYPEDNSRAHVTVNQVKAPSKVYYSHYDSYVLANLLTPQPPSIRQATGKDKSRTIPFRPPGKINHYRGEIAHKLFCEQKSYRTNSPPTSYATKSIM
jgi:hypothetical protein